MNKKVTGFDWQWDTGLFGNSPSAYKLGIMQLYSLTLSSGTVKSFMYSIHVTYMNILTMNEYI